MKRVAQVTALVAATLSAVGLLYRLRLVVALLALAIVLAAAVRPLVMALIRYRVPRGLALVAGYLCAAAAPVMVVALLLPSVGNELTAVLDGFLPSYQRHIGVWRDGGGRLALLASWLPSAKALAAHVHPAALVGGAWHATLMVLQALASGVLVVVLSLSWSVHREPVMSGLGALIPAEHRPLFRRLASDLGVGVGLHVFGETCKSLIALAVTALALAALHAPAPISPALLVAVLRVVPIAGLGLSMLAMAVAVAPLGMVTAAIVALGTGVLLLALQRIVPRLLRSREYNPLLVAFVALLLASTIGWVGLILAPAVAAAVQITIEAAFRAHQDAAQAPVTLADIRARFDQLAAETMAKKRASRRTLGLLSNLGGLLAAVESMERDPHHHPHDHQRPRFEDRAA
ncbi:MAG TPA: AI-2E family transporter [Polyangia bacterium]